MDTIRTALALSIRRLFVSDAESERRRNVGPEPLGPPNPVCFLSDEAAFLVAIAHATPGDYLPSLVYADWLEERGGPGDAQAAESIRGLPRVKEFLKQEAEWFKSRKPQSRPQ